MDSLRIFVETWLDKRLKVIKSFYPTAIKSDKFTQSEIIKILKSDFSDRIMLKWEVICPVCYRTIKVLDTYSEDSAECIICDKEFDTTVIRKKFFRK